MWRALVLGLAAAALVVPPATAAQQMETIELASRHVDPKAVPFNGPPPGGQELPPALRANVLLPDGYDANGTERYPVLFLLHGHGDTFAHWAAPERGNVRELAKGFPGIIVMPEGARGWYADWWNAGARSKPAWERFYLEELIPEIERRYRIREGRRWRAIAGLSMGGGGALLYAAQVPGYFGSAATFSGAISIQRLEWPQAFDTQGERHTDVYGDPQAQRFYWTAHNPTALGGNLAHTRFYVSVGDGTPVRGDAANYFGAAAEAELRRHAEDFVSAMTAAGAPVAYDPRPGIHDWPYWRDMFAAALQWGFFGEVPEAPRSWTYSTAASQGRAWDVSFSFDRPPEALVTISREGDVLRGSGSGFVTIAVDGRAPFTAQLPFERTIGPAAPAPAAAPKEYAFGVARLLRTQIRQARRRRAPAVRLPAQLRTTVKRLFASGTSSRRAYSLRLTSSRTCRAAAAACTVAVFSARRGGRPDPGGEPVALGGATTGRLILSRCTSTCSLGRVEWRRGGVLYAVAAREPRQSRLLALARSANR